ncbi:hypothetical protein Q4561_11655 [Alteromonas sp. 1_MG-2023]|uniref:hypothetical protein n=1 Tax=Alteromonas sp. 1_MG-2023 TaxID=3062669 RepID=UPI0026E388C2|nr:hypothetical protein [Alteromonas sp. 1_MG-2023]MDO6567715.1 hypothetical protein [Alteromonas sp. 1_MG-2023]
MIEKWSGAVLIDDILVNWPMGKLLLSNNEVTLRAGILGTYTFKPEDIYFFEPLGFIPFIGQGIKLHHKVRTYPLIIEFSCFTYSAENIVKKFKLAGFGT